MTSRGLWAFLCTAFQRVLTVSFLVSLALLLLYVLGNYQGFLDTTQYLLLDAAGITLWVAVSSGALVTVLLVVNAFVEKRFPVLRFLGTLLAALTAGALVTALEFLTAWVVR